MSQNHSSPVSRGTLAIRLPETAWPRQRSHWTEAVYRGV